MKPSKMQQVRARRATPADGEVGKRARSRRLELGLSQTELASQIGVTFQQVQKYEKGVNRIGAGRLQRIAGALQVPVSFFFGGDTSGKISEPQSVEQRGSNSVFSMTQSSGAVRLLQAFHKLRSRKMRQLLVDLAETALANEHGEQQHEAA